MSDQDPSQTVNPYAAPESPIQAEVVADGSGELADRGTRLLASIVDTLIIVIPLLAIMFFFGWFDSVASESLMMNILIAIIGFAIWLAINFKALQNGQTIAKKMFKIRIVDYNTGEVPSLATLAGVRYFVVMAIAQIPMIGQLFSLVDALFIFGNERRCVHDYMAKTRVIKVQ